MSPRRTKLTVYHDGACPLCRAEIAHYRRQDGAGNLRFQDVSAPDTVPAGDLTREAALARFHVRDETGTLLSGAAAFIAIWRTLPRWRWAARLASLPGVQAVLELGYRLFLPVRPHLSALVGRWRPRRSRADQDQAA